MYILQGTYMYMYMHGYKNYVYIRFRVHGHNCSLIFYYSPQPYQKTALHCASECGHHDTVRVLLERGADPNTHDEVSGV